MCTNSELQIITQEIAKTEKGTYGENLDTIILYGTYARGCYNEDSDDDIMSLVKWIAPEDLRKYRDSSLPKHTI